MWCIDPTGCTGAPASTWSPLTACRDWRGACRAAAELCEAAKGEGTTADGEFWYATAAKLLAPLFAAAALDGRTMTDVVRWVDTQEVGEVADILERAAPPEVLAGGAGDVVPRRAHAQLHLHHGRDRARPLRPRAPRTGRRGAASSPACSSEGRTPCTCVRPRTTNAGLRGYFTALTQHVLAEAFARATRAGRPLDPPLLVVLDEAAHIAPLPELDGLAATCASHGIQIVTVWQDLAQVRGRYGARAPTVLNNHRAKLFLPGIADPDTLEYASRLIGDEETSHPSVTRDHSGRRSTTSTTGPRRLLPPESLRCLARGRAVLVYGTLPPARLQLRPWWVQAGASQAPTHAGAGPDLVTASRTPPAGAGAPFRKGALPGVGGQGRSPVELGGGLGVATELIEQVAAHAREEVVALERPRLDELVDELQRSVRTRGHGDRHRAVQLDDG